MNYVILSFSTENIKNKIRIINNPTPLETYTVAPEEWVGSRDNGPTMGILPPLFLLNLTSEMKMPQTQLLNLQQRVWISQG